MKIKSNNNAVIESQETQTIATKKVAVEVKAETTAAIGNRGEAVAQMSTDTIMTTVRSLPRITLNPMRSRRKSTTVSISVGEEVVVAAVTTTKTTVVATTSALTITMRRVLKVNTSTKDTMIVGVAVEAPTTTKLQLSTGKYVSKTAATIQTMVDLQNKSDSKTKAISTLAILT